MQARIPYLKTELTNSEQQRRVQRCREARLFKNLQERGMMVIMESLLCKQVEGFGILAKVRGLIAVLSAQYPPGNYPMEPDDMLG